MGKVISINNQKGGVGKTTTTLALARCLCEKGYSVLVVDCDGSNFTATKCVAKQLGREGFEPTLTDVILLKTMGRDSNSVLDGTIISSEDGYDLIPADDKLVTVSMSLSMQNDLSIRFKTMDSILSQVKEKYDYILMDAAPTLDIFSINQLIAADELLIVSQCQEASTEAVGELLKTVEQYVLQQKKDFRVNGILMTMLDKREKYTQEVFDKFSSTQNLYIYDAIIPHSVSAKRCVDTGYSVVSSDPTSKITKMYKEFTREFLEKDAN